MLTHHRKPVCLSLISTDLPISSVVETSATLYQKAPERFHVLLTAPPLQQQPMAGSTTSHPRLLWIEISPYRVIMTMQANDHVSYRHYWEEGVYGLSRYWLQGELLQSSEQIRLRNFTRSLTLVSSSLPQHLRVEYELWSEKVQMGHYVLNMEIR